MKDWKFANGVEVFEKDYNHELHCFKCYDADSYLGTIYPSDLNDLEDKINRLDAGEDPVSGKWTDGCGNICTAEGWGKGDF